MKKIFAFLLTAIIFISTIPVVTASDVDVDGKIGSNMAITSKSALLMEASTGKILFEKNSHEKMHPASVTKIMTMLIVMEKIEQGIITPDTMVTASREACSMGGTQIWLKENEQMSVHDLLKACAVASANDAAFALAEAIGANKDNFVAMMNDRAQELGMNDTCFKNPTGLDADGHVTSANDIAIMSCELLRKKGITEYTSIWIDSLRNGATSLVNTNKLVRFYKGCDGLKTGTTSLAGACISATAVKNDMRLISVIMGAPNSATRFDEAKQLLEFGFTGFMLYDLKTNKLDNVKISRGTNEFVEVSPQSPLKILIPKASKNNIVEELSLPKTLPAPINSGEVIGSIKVSIDNVVIDEIAIATTTSSQKITCLSAFYMLLKRLIM